MSAPIIEVNHVTKEFQLGHIFTLKESINAIVGRIRGKSWVRRRQRLIALDAVDFKVQKGEVLGIIGENGSGKSTLFKLLARVTVPTKGSLQVRGTIAPLIEVGAGFHPELSGRENIYLNGAILGIPRRTIRRKFKEIVSFAELEKFIDTPVKRYSSGMVVRLGFSIATSFETDILMVDEVLAVGDLAFQRKCFDRMEDIIKRQKRTVLLVSHNLRQIERLCSRVILLDQGKILAEGSPKDVCQLFYERSNAKIAAQTSQMKLAGRNIRKTGEVELETLELIGKNGDPVNEMTPGSPLTVRGVFQARRAIDQPEIVYGIHTTDFFYISSMSTAHLNGQVKLKEGRNVIECMIPHLPLVPGVYCFRVNVFDKLNREIFSAEMLSAFTVKPKAETVIPLTKVGFVDIPAKWEIKVFHKV